MIETALALFAAHVFADFVLQVRWIIRNKRRARAFLAHIAIVAATAIVLLGADSATAFAAVAIITVSHALTDGTKLWLSGKPRVREHRRGKLILFLADQALHLVFILLTAWFLRDAWAQGWWATFPETWQTRFLSVLCLSAGFILATRAGGFAIELFMQGFTPPRPTPSNDAEHEPLPTHSHQGAEATASEQPEHRHAARPDERWGPKSDAGLIDGGKWIGLLERALIFVLIMAQEFQAIGFLIAAKSILRFQYSKERSHSETVIIGTLASFGWAIIVAWGTLALIDLLNA